MVRMRRLDDAGVAGAEEASHWPQARALGHEGLDQGLRLGARLAPDDRVARANYTSEIHHRGDYG